MASTVCMVGSGAMGGLFACALADAGAAVVAVDSDAATVAAIHGAGLRLRRAGVTTMRRLAGVHQAGTRERVAPADLVMVFTKGYDTDAALDCAAPWVGPQTVFLTLQNGLGNVERIRVRHPSHAVIHGLTTQTAGIVEPGLVESRSNGPAETWIWSAQAREKAESVAALLTAGGIHAAVDPDIDLAIWRKLVINCSLNPLCAVLDVDVGTVAREPSAWPMLDGIADEIAAIARSILVPLAADAARRYLRDVAREAALHHPSMVADLRAGRATEIDNLNGAVLRIADRSGLDAPWCRALDAMLRMRERTRRGGAKPDAEQLTPA